MMSGVGVGGGGVGAVGGQGAGRGIRGQGKVTSYTYKKVYGVDGVLVTWRVHSAAHVTCPTEPVPSCSGV